MNALIEKNAVSIMWFRRDLRLADNAALYYALRSPHPVLPVFIFDKHILDDLEDKKDARVEFIHTAVSGLHQELLKWGSGLQIFQELLKWGSGLQIFHSAPATAFTSLLQCYDVKEIFVNRDYEPYATERDEMIRSLALATGISFHSHKDQVIFDGNEVVKDNGEPYTVFTPYNRKWKNTATDFYFSSYPCKRYSHRFLQMEAAPVPALEQLGFRKTGRLFPSATPDIELIRNYGRQRDMPALDATSHLGIHLRFGTVSIRECVRTTIGESEVFLNELIWREFYQSILFKFPHVGKGQSFKKEYDRIPWRNDEAEFEKWCMGITGYPIVDAGMRQLNATGFMHNRVRMITASFLAKHLLIDWRWGEAYFAQKTVGLRHGFQQRGLAMGGRQWLRCGALFQDIQSLAPGKKI